MLYRYFEYLPKEIKSKIYDELSAIDLCRMAQVSRSDKSLAEQDQFWKNHLMLDFQMSERSAFFLTKRLGSTHKGAYRYWSKELHNAKNCKKVSIELQEARQELNTKHHFIMKFLKYNWPWFESFEHGQALLFLIVKCHFSEMDAILEIENTSESEAGWISEGLTREELLELPHVGQRRALCKLRGKGLNVGHLKDQNWVDYNDERFYALCYLLGKGFAIQDAMAELKDLNIYQAKGISNGLRRNDIIGLEYEWQIKAIYKLNATPNCILKNSSWFKEYEHFLKLQSLMNEHKTSADLAMPILGEKIKLESQIRQEKKMKRAKNFYIYSAPIRIFSNSDKENNKVNTDEIKSNIETNITDILHP